jgi:glyoxylase I family protein
MTFGITGLHHITLRVNDLERSRRFYEGVLGFPVDQAFPGKLRFRPAPGIRLVLHAPLPDMPAGDRFRERRIGLDHIALGVDDPAELERLVEVLRRHGVATRGIQRDPTGGSLVSFRDPDNIQWELFEN